MNNDIFRYVTLLFSVECGIASVLKTLGVPCVGQILSLHQLFILCRAKRCCQGRFLGIKISSSAALFKASIVQGKKITPFIALCMQGLLFDLGLGGFFGALLLSLWAFIQPILIYYMLFGKTLFISCKEQINSFGISDTMVYSFLCGIVFVKIVLSWLIVLFEERISDVQLARYEKRMVFKPQAQSSCSFRSKVKMAFYDLFRWPFLLGFGIIICTQVSLWYVFSTITCSFFFFLAMRTFPIEKVIRALFCKELLQEGQHSENHCFCERDFDQTEFSYPLSETLQESEEALRF